MHAIHEAIPCPWTPENSCDEAVVTYYTRLPQTWARDSEVTLKIFPLAAFYD